MSEDRNIRDLPSGKIVVMGKGDFAVGCCTESTIGLDTTGMRGIIYLTLPERRPVGTDTTDLFPIGSQANEPAAVIYFANEEAVDQTISYLNDLKLQFRERLEWLYRMKYQ